MQKIQFPLVRHIKRSVYSHSEIAVIDIPGISVIRFAEQLKAFRRTFGAIDIMPLSAAGLTHIKPTVIVNYFGSVGSVGSRLRLRYRQPFVRPMDEVFRFKHFDSVARVGGRRIKVVFPVIPHDERISDSVFALRSRCGGRTPLTFYLYMVFIALRFDGKIFDFFSSVRLSVRTACTRHQCRGKYRQNNVSPFHNFSPFFGKPRRITSARFPSSRTFPPSGGNFQIAEHGRRPVGIKTYFAVDKRP